MYLRNCFFTLILILITQPSYGQTRIFQWSDVHSTLDSIVEQARVIDHLGQDFLQKNARGEVVIVVNGDYTSITPYSRENRGEFSYEVLEYFLKNRGYTVLFVPGNHDAFDWTAEVNGVELFLEQMKKLKSWGGKILAANLKGLSGELAPLIDDYYELKETDARTRVFGLTLETLMSKSNITETTKQKLFAEVLPYSNTWQSLLSKASKDGVESIIVAIHENHQKLQKQRESIWHHQKTQEKSGHPWNFRIPLMMAGHDHVVATRKVQETLISDAGAKGSFTVIDLDRNGEVVEGSLTHWSINAYQLRKIKRELFEIGKVFTQQRILRSLSEGVQNALKDLQSRISTYLEKHKRDLARVLALTNGFTENRLNFKEGRRTLGSLLGESLVQWVKSHHWFEAGEVTAVLAMTNSSAYRLKQSIQEGELTEIMIRQMHPYATQSTIYEVNGDQLSKLFYSLRSYYPNKGENFYTPQMSLGFRESGSHLQFLQNGEWVNIQPGDRFYLALDGWLSEHRFGRGYGINEWSLLKELKPVGEALYQEVLVQFLPKVIEDFESRHILSREYQDSIKPKMCHRIFAR